MNRVLFLSVILLFANTSLFSQWYSQNSGTTNTLESVYFIDANTGWICGANGLILKTTNGGIDWINQTSNSLAELNSIFFINTNYGWACGKLSTILRTTNGGTTWIQQTLPPAASYHSIQFVNPLIGWIGGIDSSNLVNILKTTDGGLTWSLQKTVLIGYPHPFSFSAVNQDYIWVTDIAQGVWKSTDGGMDWELQAPQFSITGFVAVQFVDTLFGWLGNSNLPGTTIFITTDGGINWILKGISLSEFGSMHFVNRNYGYVATNKTFIGNQGEINRTIDGGLTWSLFKTNLRNINSLCFVNNDIGWAVGDSGKIIHTINGGLPVELISFTSNIINDDVVQLNWVTASEKNNYGFEIERRCPSQPILNDKSFGNWTKIGFIEGNGTTTETTAYSFIDKSFNRCHYFYRLKQIDYDGTTNYSQEIEVEVNSSIKLELFQNYPNPFNPSTKIRYAIPLLGGDKRGGLVTLKVYDVLGNEVATLVDEYKPTGSYEVEFNGDNLSSGIYFYTLRAGDYFSSKKMILLR